MTRSRVLLIMGVLALRLMQSSSRGSVLSCEMYFRGLIEPILTSQVRALMEQTVKSSNLVVCSCNAGLYLGLLVVVMKGIVSIDPLVITMDPDQLNYGTRCTLVV
jgi:hypothetical protein